MSRARRALARAAVLAALTLAACSSVPSSAGGDGAAPRASAAASPSGSASSASASSGPAPLGAPVPAGYTAPTAGADGLPPVVDRIDTAERVVFLSIDDGWTKDADLPALLAKYRVPVTVFATHDAIKDDTAYFDALQADGASIQNHSMTHPALKHASLATNEREICRASQAYEQDFGTRPWLFRPPFGSWSATTQQAAKACGIDYLVMWSVSQPGRYLRFAEGSHLRPGDIILLHFTPHLSEYLARTLRLLEAGGWKVGRLEDYLPKSSA